MKHINGNFLFSLYLFCNYKVVKNATVCLSIEDYLKLNFYAKFCVIIAPSPVQLFNFQKRIRNLATEN
jgi:hypothetical protein